MQTRAAQTRHATEEATARGSQAQDVALHQLAVENDIVSRAAARHTGGNRNACLTSNSIRVNY